MTSTLERVAVTPTAEHVVLLSDDGAPIGTALKGEVHHSDTPLHLAFSCHVLSADGTRVLLTRRALSKRTWPGTWTNAFCGHPQPGEEMTDAVARRAQHELGLTLHSLRPALPGFRYRAVDASGIVEHEICPVFVAHADTDITPEPTEVMDTVWAEPAAVARAIVATPWAFSPWLVEQVAEMIALGESSPINWGSP